MNKIQPHPLGTRAKILLTSVFGPYAQDDEFGSRTVNPMELYHNQVTRVQGAFSLRMFHRSAGLMMIQQNINAPCALLDFPTLDRFIEELKTNFYDVVGISSIYVNIYKVKKMCELIRQYLPKAKIVIGGHIASFKNLKKYIDTDYICRGDGISWFRKYLGEDDKAAVNHPEIISGFGGRIVGLSLPHKSTAATLIPSVGCPMGCNFCSTSHLFGGKGKSICFYKTGEEIFDQLCRLEQKLNVKSFFIMDENFLLYKQRALRLLELMEEHNKSWLFYVFSSAKVIQTYTQEQLLGLGIAWIWMGIEGKESAYSKVKGVDTHELVRTLQSHGIRVLGSTIIGLENHTRDNIDDVIEWAVSHNTDFHQFMLYSPLPGTPLYEHHVKNRTLLSEKECPYPDSHGQFRFNFRHKFIKTGMETEFLLKAFRRDFEVNGPSIARLTSTLLNGWSRYKNHPNLRVRERIHWESRRLADIYPSIIWSLKHMNKNNETMYHKMNTLLTNIKDEFGIKAKTLSPIVGRWMTSKIKKEDRRLANGWTYEPKTFYEKNKAALLLEKEQNKNSTGAVLVPQES